MDFVINESYNIHILGRKTIFFNNACDCRMLAYNNKKYIIVLFFKYCTRILFYKTKKISLKKIIHEHLYNNLIEL